MIRCRSLALICLLVPSFAGAEEGCPATLRAVQAGLVGQREIKFIEKDGKVNEAVLTDFEGKNPERVAIHPPVKRAASLGSATGRYIAIMSDDDKSHLLNLDTGARIAAPFSLFEGLGLFGGGEMMSYAVLRNGDRRAILDPKSGKLIPLDAGKDLVPIVQDGSVVYLVGNGKRAQVLDVSTGKKEHVDLPIEPQGFFSFRPGVISGYAENGSVTLVRFGKKWRVMDLGPRSIVHGQLPNGDLLYANYHEEEGRAQDFFTIPAAGGKAKPVYQRESHGRFLPEFTQDGKYWQLRVYGEEKGAPAVRTEIHPLTVSITDLTKDSRPEPLIAVDGERQISLSPDNRFATSYNPFASQLDIISMEQKKTIASVPDAFAARFPEGKSVAIAAGMNESQIVDLGTGEARAFPGFGAQVADDGRVWIDTQVGSFVSGATCVDHSVKILPDEDCNCDLDAPAAAKGGESKLAKGLRAKLVASACEGGAPSATEWEALLPYDGREKLSESDALLFVRRFQRHGGFDPTRHSALLDAIFTSPLREKHLGELVHAVRMIGVTHPQVADRVLALGWLPENELRALKALPERCGKAEEKQIAEFAENRLKMLLEAKPKQAIAAHWRWLTPYRGLLRGMDPEKREATADEIATSLANGASETSRLKDFFYSKLYYFSLHHANFLLGDDAAPVSDLSVVRTKNETVPFVLATAPISGAADHDAFFAIHQRREVALSFPEGTPKETKKQLIYDWTVAGQPFSAKVDATYAGMLDDFAPNVTAPDYAAFRKDGVVTGLIVAGTNLATDAGHVIDEYVNYYQQQGFKFGKPKEIKNTSEFFTKQIREGAADYFIKEAHSDGDEKNLFRVTEEGTLLEGNRLGPKGKKERIYLVVPGKSEKTKLISNQEFGEMIRDREKNGHGQFLYFNASCGSISKAINEIISTRSRTLLEIPSITTVSTFTNEPGHSLRIMLEGVRKEKSFQQIRADIEKFAVDKDEKYLMPGDEKFQELVHKPLRLPNIDAAVSVFGADGKPLHFDRNLGH